MLNIRITGEGNRTHITEEEADPDDNLSGIKSFTIKAWFISYIKPTCTGPTQTLKYREARFSLLIIYKNNWIENYLCANPADRSSLLVSVDIIVVICPTLWSNLARPERRRDFRKIAPINYNPRTLSAQTWSIEKLFIDLLQFELRDRWS